MKQKITFSIIFLLSLSFGLSAQCLKVSENNRFLAKEDGSPFFWMGDTSWELIHKLDSNEVAHYIRNRKAKGFNIFQTVIVAEMDGLRNPNVYGEVPFHDLDPTKPNEAYFKYVDYVVEKAAEFGMYVALEPTWAIHVIYLARIDNLHVFTPENARIYGEWLGKRYKDNWNVVWMLGGDTNPTKDGRIDIWEQLALGLDEGTTKKQLITYQPTGYSASVDFIHDKEWLDFNGVQVGHRRRNNADAQLVKKSWDKTPAKPVLNLESTYEDHPVKSSDLLGPFIDYDVRKSAYWSVFSGSLGYTYGNHVIWQMHRKGDKGRALEHLDYTWEEAMNAPGAKQMGYLRKLIESRPQLTRMPDQDLILRAHGLEPRLGLEYDRLVALYDGTSIEKQDASYLMAYSPVRQSVKVNTSVIDDKRIKVWLFSPSTGSAFFVEEVENSGKYSINASRYLSKSEGADWVLVVDAAGKKYPAPGN